MFGHVSGFSIQSVLSCNSARRVARCSKRWMRDVPRESGRGMNVGVTAHLAVTTIAIVSDVGTMIIEMIVAVTTVVETMVAAMAVVETMVAEMTVVETMVVEMTVVETMVAEMTVVETTVAMRIIAVRKGVNVGGTEVGNASGMTGTTGVNPDAGL